MKDVEFFVAYFTGEFGTSLGMFVLENDNIVGADVGGATYEGLLRRDVLDGALIGTIRFRTRKAAISILGGSNDLPILLEAKVNLKLPLEDQAYHQIDTEHGSFNVRFERVTVNG